jgi:hypothetical protein
MSFVYTAVKRLPTRIGAGLLAVALGATCAVFTSTLQSGAVTAWEKYIERAERGIAAGIPPVSVSGDAATLNDLNPNGSNAGEDVRSGYVHDWIGAVLIPNTSVAAVEAVLENYGSYARIYAPDLKLASATKTADDAAGRTYDVRMITERVEGIGLHFAFDLRNRVSFRSVGGDTRIDSRSYSIRESNKGKAPYTDLLPEGSDHGILWRLNSYWRLRQTGSSVYAELRVISLSRKPLAGTRDLVKNRARESLEHTLVKTRSGTVSNTGG